MEQLSKKQLKKLGKRLRDAQNPNTDDLERLQKYRCSFRDVVAEVFSIVDECTKDICPSAICSYRIKRIDSIIGKLRRLRGRLELDSMVDIAGCRFIVNKDAEIYKIIKRLESTSLEITKINNNIGQNAKETGYKSVHIHAYLEKYGEGKQIEIQLRSNIHHNWATFVETTDSVYGLRLKEGVIEIGKEKEYNDFYRFHQIMAKSEKKKSLEEKLYLLDNIVRYDIIGKLNDIILNNIVHVRLQWLVLTNSNNNSLCCYILSNRKGLNPEILGFTNFENAENEYFKLFANNINNDNIVLLNMPNTNYDQITKAYSNYLMVGHEFLRYFNRLMIEVFDITSNLNTSQLKPYLTYYDKVTRGYSKYMRTDLALLGIRDKLPQDINTNEWYDDVHKRVRELLDDYEEFQKEFHYRYLHDTKRTRLGKFLFKILLKLRYK